MAKFYTPHPDIQSIFDEVIVAAGLDQYLTITVISNNKAKDLYKVNKANDLLKYRSGDDIIIVLNEQIFEKIPAAQQLIIAEEAISFISFDPENDKTSISQPDFTAHTGVLQKYGFETIQNVRVLVKALYQAEKEAEDEAKANPK